MCELMFGDNLMNQMSFCSAMKRIHNIKYIHKTEKKPMSVFHCYKIQEVYFIWTVYFVFVCLFCFLYLNWMIVIQYTRKPPAVKYQQQLTIHHPWVLSPANADWLLDEQGCMSSFRAVLWCYKILCWPANWGEKKVFFLAGKPSIMKESFIMTLDQFYPFHWSLSLKRNFYGERVPHLAFYRPTEW